MSEEQRPAPKHGFRVARLAIVLFLVLLAVSFWLFLRSSYVSDRLTARVIAIAEDATKREIEIERIYVNIFPSYVGLKGFTLHAADGKKTLSVEKARASIRITELFIRRRIEVGKIVLIKPVLYSEESEITDVRANIKQYLKDHADAGGGYIGDLGTLAVKAGALSYRDEGRNATYEAQGIDAEIALRKHPKAEFLFRKLTIRPDQGEPRSVRAAGTVLIEENAVAFDELSVEYEGAVLRTSGRMDGERRGEFDVDLELPMMAVQKTLGHTMPDEGRLYAQGKVAFSGDIKKPFVDLRAHGDFRLETLMEAVGVPLVEHDLAGHITFEGTLRGEGADLDGMAEASIADASFYHVRTKSAHCTVEYKNGRLGFRKGQAEVYGGRAEVEVEIGLPHVVPYSVDVKFFDAQGAQALKLVGLENLGLSEGRVTGRISTDGETFQPRGWFTYASTAPGGDAVGRVSRVFGRYQSKGDLLFLSDTRARSEASELSFGGYFNLHTKEMFLSGDVTTSDIGDLAAPYYERISGRASFSGTVSSTSGDPVVEGTIVGHEVMAEDMRLGEVEGVIAYRKNMFRILSMRARNGDRVSSAKGLIEFPTAEHIFDLRSAAFDLSLVLKGSPIGRIMALQGHDGASVEGEADLDLTLKGTAEKPSLKGKAVVSGLSTYERAFTRGECEFSYEDETFSIMNATLERNGSRVTGKGSIARSGKYSFEARASNTPLGFILGIALPFDYASDMAASGRGSLAEPYIEIKAELTRGVYESAVLEDVLLEAELRGGALGFKANLMNGKASLHGTLSLRDNHPWKADLDFKQARLNFLVMPYFKRPPEDLLLSATGNASFTGDKNGVDGSVRLDRMNITVHGVSLTNARPVTAVVRRGGVSVEEASLRSESITLNARGHATPDGDYEISTDGAVSLSLLKNVWDSIEEVAGDARFLFTVKGNRRNSKVSGSISLSGGSLAVKRYPFRLDGVGGYAYLDDGRMVVESLRGRVGGGSVNASGVIDMDGFSVRQAYLDADVKSVRLDIAKGFDLSLDGDLALRVREDKRDVAGYLRITRASLVKRIDWKTWLIQQRKLEAVRPAAGWADSVNLNVSIAGSEGLLVNNNIAKAAIRVDMVLKGTLAQPALIGRMESSGGKVFFRNSELNIVSATADFTGAGGTDPYLTISAETSIKGYNIHLNLDGGIGQLNMSLSSDPPLQDVEILGLLTIGEFGESLDGLEGGIGAAEATSFITGKIQDVFEERFKDITGIDRFRVEPYVSKTTGSLTPRVTLSKSLAEDKLLVSYSASMGSSEEQELTLEYVLTPTVSLIGGRDDLGSLGGDIRLRLNFR